MKTVAAFTRPAQAPSAMRAVTAFKSTIASIHMGVGMVAQLDTTTLVHAVTHNQLAQSSSTWMVQGFV